MWFRLSGCETPEAPTLTKLLAHAFREDDPEVLAEALCIGTTRSLILAVCGARVLLVAWNREESGPAACALIKCLPLR